MSLSILPFSVQLPAGYSLSTSDSGNQGKTDTGGSQSTASNSSAKNSTAAEPVDIITIGNTTAAGGFTAKEGDTFRLSALVTGGVPSGQAIAGYRVALGAGDGRLYLGTKDVTGQTNFTADEYRQLTYVAGGASGTQNLTVVARTGTGNADNSILAGEIDSPAVQITATVGDTRSINAMNALATPLDPTDPDASTVSIAQAAGIFTGWSGAARPTLQTALAPRPNLSLSELEQANGAYQSASANASASAIDLTQFYQTATGSSVSPGAFTVPGGPLAIALLLLDGTAEGSFRATDDATVTQAISAYTTTKNL